MKNKLTEEQINFLKENVKGKTLYELAEIFNKKFNTDYTTSQVKWFKESYKLKSGKVSGNRIFTEVHINFLKNICEGKTIYEITEIFNKEFNMDMKKKQIDNAMKRFGLRSNLERNVARKIAFDNGNIESKYTTEQRKFIKENVKGKSISELVEMVNTIFGTNYRKKQIERFIYNNNLKNGLDCRFKKGSMIGKEYRFKKGNIPYMQLPVGTEVVTVDGYINVKIANPNKWKRKHIMIWEKYNGPVPYEHAIIFGDKNKRNFDLNNLLSISRKQLMVLNSKKLIHDDVELTKTGVIIADLHLKISEMKNKL